MVHKSPLNLRGRWAEQYQKEDLADEIVKLRRALSECVIEIERLHLLHAPVFEDKIGEPDLHVAKRAQALLPGE